MSTHIIFATRRSARAVGAMQRHAFKAADLDRDIARACRDPQADQGYIAQLRNALKHERTAAKRAQGRFDRAQRDLEY